VTHSTGQKLVMPDTPPRDLSFRGWYSRTIGKWWFVSRVAAWVIYGWVIIPLAYGGWRYAVWFDEWSKTHGKEAAAQFHATHAWVEQTVTKRGRVRRGYWRRK
jgi:hypothetical protein